MTIKASLRFSVLAGTLLLYANAWAGLGKINVRSNLGEPFRAEIPLTATAASELAATKVGLASPDTFRQFQVDYSGVLSSLHFAIVRGSQGPVIRISSAQPINEPFLRFVVEAQSNSSRSVREYTVLLDPPEYAGVGRQAQVEQPEPIVQDLPGYADDNLSSRFRNRKPAGEAVYRRPSELLVTRHATLRSLAAKVKPQGASLSQTMAALAQANPQALIDDNPNQLRRGATLKVPSVAEIKSIAPGEARRLLAAAAPAPAAAPAGEMATAQPSTRPAGAPPQTLPATSVPSRAASGTGVLKLMPAEASGTTNVRLTELENQIAARDKTLKDAEDRIAALEAQLKALKGGALPASGAKPAIPASTPVPAPAPVVPPHQPPVPPPEQAGVGLMARLMDNLPLIGGAAAAVLLAVLLGLRIVQRRRKGGANAGLAAAALGIGAAAAGMKAAPAGVATTGHSFMSDFTRSFGEIDAGEVDPVAEAEVYIAYGRDEQAEEILKDALARDPARHEVRMKLLEIYAARLDKASFERVARELHAAFDGKGQLWGKAAAMGQALDPGNPLYEVGEPASQAAAPAASAAGLIDLDQELMGMQQPAPAAAPAPEAPIDLMAEFETQNGEAQPQADEDALRSALFGEEKTAEAKPEPVVSENMLYFDLDSLAQEAAAEVQKETAEPPVHDNMLDFDFPLEGPAAEPAAAAPAEKPIEPDLGDFAALYDSAPEAPVSTSGLTVSDDPLSTKLDLAKVYLDMGDSDGAKEVLKELLEESQGTLREEAQALLAKLGG